MRPEQLQLGRKCGEFDCGYLYRLKALALRYQSAWGEMLRQKNLVVTHDDCFSVERAAKD